MALTDTTASKKFIAGAPDIILNGDRDWETNPEISHFI